jgi:DHA1 family tetracycline resistance protein-like MFS transporter
MAGDTRGPRQAALAFIFVTVLLDGLAIGVVIPVLPMLVAGFLGGDIAQAAETVGDFGLIFAAMQFVASPVVGALSDRIGRRPIILMSNFGLGLDYVLMALAPTLALLFVGRVISGITAASFSTAGAYIADVTPPEKRAAGFGLLGAAFGLAFVLGPALGGLLGSIEPRLPFWGAAGLSLANALYGLFVLPESLARDKRSAFSWKKANPVASLAMLGRHGELLGLASSNFLNFLAHEVLPNVWVLYATYRYGWGEASIGLTLAAVGLCSIVTQAGMVRSSVARLGERNVLLGGLVFGVFGFAIYGLAPTGLLFCIGIPIMALWALTGPVVQSLMTRHVGPEEQGQLQGALSALRGISGMIGPKLFTTVFAVFIASDRAETYPGAPFLLSALLVLVSIGFVWQATRRRPLIVSTSNPG